jgi:hypothetical protein
MNRKTTDNYLIGNNVGLFWDVNIRLLDYFIKHCFFYADFYGRYMY